MALHLSSISKILPSFISGLLRSCDSTRCDEGEGVLCTDAEVAGEVGEAGGGVAGGGEGFA